ncbi:MAG: hypothetical protein GQF41_1591 [Candidatus Rifleibacterium amylolyticum]|nr:MAG: hypothetical protein GQF41_1591 [Candidatus Rifleibacterium amylolyticum]
MPCTKITQAKCSFFKQLRARSCIIIYQQRVCKDENEQILINKGV